MRSKIEKLNYSIVFPAATHDTVSVESIGQSYLGEDMRVIKICSGECGSKPALYIEGGKYHLHAHQSKSLMEST